MSKQKELKKLFDKACADRNWELIYKYEDELLQSYNKSIDRNLNIIGACIIGIIIVKLATLVLMIIHK